MEIFYVRAISFANRIVIMNQNESILNTFVVLCWQFIFFSYNPIIDTII
jgi:hypothetical protein